MDRISATLRIAIGLACLSASVILSAQALGLIPDRHAAVVEGRQALSESVAISCSLLASNNDFRQLENSLQATVERNAQLLAASVVRADGKLLAEITKQKPVDAAPDEKTATMSVPILSKDDAWGTVDLVFRDPDGPTWVTRLLGPNIKLGIFVTIASLAVFYVYLRKMLQHMDPSKVVPGRVRSALDTLAEGLLVLDTETRIVLANQAFATIVGWSTSALQGKRASDLPWHLCEGEEAELPWDRSFEDGKPRTGVMLTLESANAQLRKFIVNTTPIMGEDGEVRGTLASFDDVTAIEKNRAELHEMLEQLKSSQEKVRQQNRELQVLATRDPLTGCLNRRSFFEHFSAQWEQAQKQSKPIGCLMVDIDHFKSINDQHGHSMGDEVLRKVAGVLNHSAREEDLVCRFGGEEFCIVLPGCDILATEEAAERLRCTIRDLQFPNLSVTASLGVSDTRHGAQDPQEMLDQADQSLYVAKRGGRNRVVRWDQVPEEGAPVEAAESGDERSGRTPPPRVTRNESLADAIPFHAVTALVSALAYRDAPTARHSLRVADLATATAHGLMSVRDSYILEVAALLHDIGKIGVPDSVLLKPGKLTDEEWKLMRRHDRIGVEIVRSAFSCEDLAQLVQASHAWFGSTPHNSELPAGEKILLGARILKIADAYDAMVSDSVYRKGREREDAFEELRRCAGKQFDPELVERFIETVRAKSDVQTAGAREVSKPVALDFGAHVQRIAAALEAQDLAGMAALANHLNAAASQHEVPEVAAIAKQLEEAANDHADLKTLIHTTNELLEICRSIQLGYLDQRCEIRDIDEWLDMPLDAPMPPETSDEADPVVQQ